MSNQSTLVEQMFSRVAKYGYAIGRGKDAFADMGNDVYRVVRDDHESDVSIVKPFYVDVRAVAVADAIAGGKPLKDQSEKSRNTQINKMENFAHLGTFARTNDAVDVGFEYARKLASNGYTKLVKCAVAMKAELAKDASADETTLKDAVDKALTETPELASEAIGKLADAFETFAHGAKDEPSKHQAMLSRLLQAYPQDYVAHIAQCFSDVRVKLEQFEAADAAKLDKAAKWSV